MTTGGATVARNFSIRLIGDAAFCTYIARYRCVALIDSGDFATASIIAPCGMRWGSAIFEALGLER
jgi:hypothetical protein